MILSELELQEKSRAPHTTPLSRAVRALGLNADNSGQRPVTAVQPPRALEGFYGYRHPPVRSCRLSHCCRHPNPQICQSPQSFQPPVPNIGGCLVFTVPGRNRRSSPPGAPPAPWGPNPLGTLLRPGCRVRHNHRELLMRLPAGVARRISSRLQSQCIRLPFDARGPAPSPAR